MYRGKAYKYRGFGGLDPNAKARIEEMLVSRKCYFAKPSSLNDSFDCKPSLLMAAGDLRNYIVKLGKKKGLNLASTQITQTVIDIRNEYNDDKFQAVLDKEVGVFCLSESPTLGTQWAYYGENHSGFSVEYDINEKFDYPAVRVNYSKERPEIDLIRFQSELSYRLNVMKELVITKSDEWNHEKEVRVLNRGSGLYEVSSSNITGVVFGLRAEPENVDFIRSIIMNHKLDINCYQCKESGEHFKLHLAKM